MRSDMKEQTQAQHEAVPGEQNRSDLMWGIDVQVDRFCSENVRAITMNRDSSETGECCAEQDPSKTLKKQVNFHHDSFIPHNEVVLKEEAGGFL